MDQKHCAKCRAQKPLSEFHKRTQSRDGYQTRCKACVSEYGARYYGVNRGQVQQRSREYNRARRAENPLWRKLKFGRERARAAGVPADLIAPDEVLADWQRRGIDPDNCVYTGEPLRDGWHLDHAVPLSHPHTPGHIVTNLVPCNPGVNRSKRSRHWLDFLADRAEAARA